MSPPEVPLNIAIVGAGPAGLTLARLLQINKISCTVYEAEPNRHSRNQGGSLDLHPGDGQAALKAARLWEKVRPLTRPESECMKLLDKSGNVLWDENVTGASRPADLSNRPEIDRTVLKDTLLDSLETGTVRWSQRISHIEEEPQREGIHTLHFTNGTKHTGIDLLIGADGAFSRTRSIVTDVEPFYSGITMVELWKLDCDAQNPWLAKQVGAGSCFMFDQDRAILAQRQNNHALRAYVCLRKPLDWSKNCGIDWTQQSTARQRLADDYFGDCAEDVKRMINETDDNIVLRHAWMLPVGLRWASKPGVTLIGDAAHLMTPFAGVGVNAAMADALDLANILIAKRGGREGLSEVVREYEEKMFPRAKKYATKTWEGLQHHFRATGSQEWADMFSDHAHAHKKDCAKQ